jgi:predicted dehydrogenase
MTLRVGVIGLGMMGRNHARVLTQMDGVQFIGAVDPAGAPRGALIIGDLFGSVGEMLSVGVDAAIVAVPTEEHEAVATVLAGAGVHMLVEKPVAVDTSSARRVEDAFETAGLVAAVGHIERFNPALQEMRRRLNDHELGRLFSISTERVGPFPNRIRDVGVVKDLASHDIDLVRWLGGGRIATVAAQTAHKMGREHEDLVVVTGRLDNDIVVSLNVNWLTPAKRRTVTVLGERGALVADMLAADLTFFANADTPSEWDAMARLRGVSEGDMIRYAIRKREPLQVELEHFRNAVLGDPDAQVVTLAEGVEVLRVAESILATAASARLAGRNA